MADADSRAGLLYADAAALAWVHRVHAPHDPALSQAFEAPERLGLPAIQVGPSEGKLLALLLRLVAARQVVEVGTLAGYSALQMARTLPPDGHLWTLELDPVHAVAARESLRLGGVADRSTVLEGSALETLPSLESEGPFDAVFLDADKGAYDQYGRWAAAHLRPGGLLLADNVYLFGRLLEDSAEAAAMRRFHEEAAAAFDTVVIPTPDGLLLGIRR